MKTNLRYQVLSDIILATVISHMEACSTDFKKIYKASEIAEPEFQTDNSEILELLVTFDKRQPCQGYQNTQHPS